MEQSKSFQGWSFDDIVFYNRNQQYGAYQLRKEKARNSIIGLLITIGVAGVLIAGSFVDLSFLKSKPKEEVVETTVTLTEPPPLKDETPPPPPPPPPPPVRPTVKFLEMVAKKDEEVRKEDEPVKVTEIKDQTISTETHEGKDDAPAVVEAPVIESKPIVEDKIFTVVEQMPSYPGGEGAMMKFIQEHINYPDMERENDIQGRVVVGFVVTEDGSLTDIQVKKGVSDGINREALRVVRMLPKFNPGKQQGKPVKVSYVLPIMFKLASQ
ncbi:MAG: energy transducer TonB [Bacteroidetes bacterium]|nr:energy transducer TonB [Bacteroidota bacterium]MBS1685014.1 energy transducer TonB [Bacteroidota bacterium]